MFRQQDDWAGQLVERRVRQSQLRRGDISKSDVQRAPSKACPKPKQQLARNAIGNLALERPLSKQITIDMENAALHRFYLEYAYTSGTCPFLYLVEPLYEEVSTPTCLHSAVHAISMATMARQTRRHEIMAKAEGWYGKTLRDLATALSQSDAAKHDGTILTVALLGLYEVSSALKHIFHWLPTAERYASAITRLTIRRQSSSAGLQVKKS